MAGTDFYSPSFRRGSAMHALSCGIPAAVIRAMGDWKSNVYLNYLDQFLLSVISHYRWVLATSLPSLSGSIGRKFWGPFFLGWVLYFRLIVINCFVTNDQLKGNKIAILFCPNKLIMLKVSDGLIG